MLLIYMSIILTLITTIMILLNFALSNKKNIKREKNSPFECGFDPLSLARIPFSIQFFMISLIFLIFDVEIIILLPLIPSLMFSPMKHFFFNLLLFIIILCVGLFIEWTEGALKWIK